MDKESLTVSDCIRMFEKEKKHVVLHAGKVTDIDTACNKGIQENITASCMPSEQQASVV
jgi:hypothetical protein